MKTENCLDCLSQIQQPKRGVRLYCEECRARRRLISKKENEKERRNQNVEAYRKKRKERYKLLETTPEKRAIRSVKTMETKERLREQVFSHYGKKCKCCGEERIEFLSIDHVEGGGNQHRREVGNYINLYRWIVKNDFPATIQILCFNCNLAKGFFGYCPHEKET